MLVLFSLCRQSRNVTKKVFAIIKEVSNTILRSKVPGEPATVIETDAMILMLQQENLRDRRVRFYPLEDGAWFKIPAEAMTEIAGLYGKDDINTQVSKGIDQSTAVNQNPLLSNQIRWAAVHDLHN